MTHLHSTPTSTNYNVLNRLASMTRANTSVVRGYRRKMTSLLQFQDFYPSPSCIEKFELLGLKLKLKVMGVLRRSPGIEKSLRDQRKPDSVITSLIFY